MKKISDLTLPQKILEGVCSAVLAGMFLELLIFWGRIPDRIPGHYNGAGAVDRWGSKWELFILPVAGVFMYLVMSACCALLWKPIRKGAASVGLHLDSGHEAGGFGDLCRH